MYCLLYHIRTTRDLADSTQVHFIGVFDSVASVGFIPRTLPLSSTPKNKPAYFRHAMALDERRAKFKVARYQRRDRIIDPAQQQHHHSLAAAHEQPEGPVRTFSADLGVDKLTPDDSNPYTAHETKPVQDTNILEVWFAGCHADVGGGAVGNDVRHKLSQIPLRWMLRQCFECDTGIMFHAHRLAEEGLDVHTLWPKYTRLERPKTEPPRAFVEKYEKGELGHIRRRKTALQPVPSSLPSPSPSPSPSREPQGKKREKEEYALKIWHDASQTQHADYWVPEQVEDFFDALQPMNDQLAVAPSWWILEYLPVEVKLQNAERNAWTTAWAMNMGMFRPVQESDPHLHWTVQERMDREGYQVRVRTNRDVEWRVVV